MESSHRSDVLDFDLRSSGGARSAVEGLDLSVFGRYGASYDDSELQQYATVVGNRVALNSARPAVSCRFIVVRNNRSTAASLSGGIVLLTTGLMYTLEDESELAGVLAHEVSHVVRGDPLRLADQADFPAGIEEQADRAAFEMALRAGYDPRGLERVLRRLAKGNPGPPRYPLLERPWLSSPSTMSERIRRLEELSAAYPEAARMERARERYQLHRIRCP